VLLSNQTSLLPRGTQYRASFPSTYALFPGPRFPTPLTRQKRFESTSTGHFSETSRTFVSYEQSQTSPPAQPSEVIDSEMCEVSQ
ncbi:hypothetical protein NL526_28665, partial [Klebsiella pneumoniae]|nr:hypothetical protein [Klebsiella pneumoniae]